MAIAKAAIKTAHVMEAQWLEKSERVFGVHTHAKNTLIIVPSTLKMPIKTFYICRYS